MRSLELSNPTESRWQVPRAGGGGGTLALMGVWGMGKFRRWRGRLCLMPPTRTLKMAKVVDLTLCVFFHKKANYLVNL